MFLDNEQNILNEVCTYALNQHNYFLYNNNSFNRKIINALKDEKSILPNFGHDNYPPDFYCEKHNIMFDVLRINDTEVRKGYNPVMIEERKIEKEIRNLNSNLNKNNIEIFTTGSSSYVIENHTYENYKKQGLRTISHHIENDKIEKYWETNFPNIKNKGLLIYDETECYFEGKVILQMGRQALYVWDAEHLPVIHHPWEDKNFIDIIYKSKIDFVIWVTPYKPFGEICRKQNIFYPIITIIDTRYPASKYTNYNYDILVVG